MPRIVRVACIAQGGIAGPTIEANRRRMAGLIELALADHPDIIAVPESFTLGGLNEPFNPGMAEDVPGPTLEMAAGYARAHGVYILCPIVARRPDGLHIEAFLLDRGGQIAGSYQKNHPVVEGCEYTKLEFGSRPGSALPVFETDFGKIGVQICFDVEYRAGWDALAAGGAEIFFWLSAYDGGRDLSAMAWNYHRYLASAVQTRHARILSPMAEVLAISGEHEPVAFASIDLDLVLFHMDFNKAQIPAIRQKYGPDVILRAYHEEGCFTLQTTRPGLTVAEVAREFQLDPLPDYLARVERMQDALRAGQPLPALNPPYAQREQWV